MTSTVGGHTVGGRATEPGSTAGPGRAVVGALAAVAIAVTALWGAQSPSVQDQSTSSTAAASTLFIDEAGATVSASSADSIAVTKLVVRLPKSWSVRRTGQVAVKSPEASRCTLRSWVRSGSGRHKLYRRVTVRCVHPATSEQRTVTLVNKSRRSQRIAVDWTWETPQPDVTTPPPATGLRGDPTDYSLTYQPKDSTSPIGFDPCQPVDVLINPGGYGQAELDRAVAAVKLVAATSGLDVRYQGTTSFVPTSAHRYSTAGGTEIVMALTSTSKTDLLAGSAIGYGGRQWSGTSWMFSTAGFAVYDTPTLLNQSESVRLAVYLHELGHAIGLNHAKGKQQLMYPVVQSDVDPSWGAGDSAGLVRLGSIRCQTQ